MTSNIVEKQAVSIAKDSSYMNKAGWDKTLNEMKEANTGKTKNKEMGTFAFKSQ